MESFLTDVSEPTAVSTSVYFNKTELYRREQKVKSRPTAARETWDVQNQNMATLTCWRIYFSTIFFSVTFYNYKV